METILAGAGVGAGGLIRGFGEPEVIILSVLGLRAHFMLI